MTHQPPAHYSISKEFAFSASHVLRGLPPDHQCARLHGHNYVIVVQLSSDRLDDTGFVVDYGDLAPVKGWIDKVLDHRHLNDVWPDDNPTAEFMARTVAGVVASNVRLPAGVHVAVGVSETPKTWAWWRE